VTGVEQPSEIATPPAKDGVEPPVEGAGHATERPEGHGARIAPLDPADHLARHLRPTRKILLPPAPLHPDPAERDAQLPIIHRDSLASTAYRRLIRGSTAAHPGIDPAFIRGSTPFIR
jgi:hypothetical protein